MDEALLILDILSKGAAITFLPVIVYIMVGLKKRIDIVEEKILQIQLTAERRLTSLESMAKQNEKDHTSILDVIRSHLRND